MLVLERGVGEKVIVGDYELTITVVRVGNGRVRIGFEAPPGVDIQRLERIIRDNDGKAVSGGG